MSFARDVYTATSSQTDFTISFPYQAQEDVIVTQNGSTVDSADYTFPVSTTIRLDTGATTGDTIVLLRSTSQAVRDVDFTVGPLTEADLDNANIQVFYLAQESIDQSALSLRKDSAELWDATSTRIINVPAATAGGDAANKDYVDAIATGTLGSPISVANGGTGSATVDTARAALYVGTRVFTKNTDYTALLQDRNSVFNCEAGLTTFTFDAVANLGTDWSVCIVNNTGGTITLDGNAAETINSAATQTVIDGESRVVICDGTELYMAGDISGYSLTSHVHAADLGLRGTNYGLVPSHNATDVTNDIDFTAGSCWDTTGASYITVAALTKRADAAWAAGTNQGMIDTGSFTTLTTYYFWAILHTDGTTDILMSTADTWAGVTKPTGYTKGQLIHALPAASGPRWLEVEVEEDEVQLQVNTSVYSSSSLTTNVAVTITIGGQVPKLSMGRFIAQANASSPASSIAAFVGDTSESGGSFVASGYWSGSTFGTYQVRGYASVLVDASQQVAGGMTWNAGDDTYTLYAAGYTFTRRFAGT